MIPCRLGLALALLSTSLASTAFAQGGGPPDIPDLPSCLGTTLLPVYFSEVVDGETRHFIESGVFGVVIDEAGNLKDTSGPLEIGERTCWQSFLLQTDFGSYDPSSDPASSDVDGDGRSSLAEFIQGTNRLVVDEPLFEPYTVSWGQAGDGSPVLYLDLILDKRAQSTPFMLKRSQGDGSWTEVTAFAFEGCAQPSATHVRYRLRVPVESVTPVPFIRLEWTLQKLAIPPF